ncbi:hypothetical protein D3C78_1535260 [compost metagenome]
MFATISLPGQQGRGPNGGREAYGLALLIAAVAAKFAHQPLGYHQLQAGGNQIAGNPHMGQARQGFAGGVGVQCG